MSDIVERLRTEYNSPGRPVSKGRLLIEAADEIERLRAELDLERRRLATSEELRTGLVGAIWRLRAALAKAMDWFDPDIPPNGMTNRETASTIRRFLATGEWSIGERPHFTRTDLEHSGKMPQLEGQKDQEKQ